MKKRNINLTLPPELWQSLENEAKNMGLGLATYIRVRLLNIQPQLISDTSDDDSLADEQAELEQLEPSEHCAYSNCDDVAFSRSYCQNHQWILCEHCHDLPAESISKLQVSGKHPESRKDLQIYDNKAVCYECKPRIVKFMMEREEREKEQAKIRQAKKDTLGIE